MASELSCKLCGVRTATVYCRNDDAFLCSICDTAVHNSFNVLAHHHERFLLGDEQSRVYMPHRDAFRQWDAQPGGQDVVVAQTSSSLSSALMESIFPNPYDVDVGYSSIDGTGQHMSAGRAFPGQPMSSLLVQENDGVVPRRMEVGPPMEPVSPLGLHPAHRIVTTGDDASAYPLPIAKPEKDSLQKSKGQDIHPLPICEGSDGRHPTNTYGKGERSTEDIVKKRISPHIEHSGCETADRQPPRTMTIRTRAATLAAAQGVVLHRDYGNGAETRADKLARYRAKRARRSFAKTIRYETRRVYAEVRPRIKGRFVTPEELACHEAGGAPMQDPPAEGLEVAEPEELLHMVPTCFHGLEYA
uniref:Zinc finger protein CONSTANS-LIKE 4 n=2 Tax=Auxenochlorella protothecoides TaxID=3075 RepID=A0A1D2A0D2_AUXPR